MTNSKTAAIDPALIISRETINRWTDEEMNDELRATILRRDRRVSETVHHHCLPAGTRVGARVELTGMGIDPDPLAVGDRGTVRDVRDCGNFAQIEVAWDSGRGLMLDSAADTYIVLNEVPLSEVRHGMVIRTPDFLRDPALDGGPIESETLRVDYWNWDDGECLLRAPEGDECADPCIADLGDVVIVRAYPETSVPLAVVLDHFTVAAHYLDGDATDDERFDLAYDVAHNHDLCPLEEDEDDLDEDDREADVEAVREWAYQLLASTGRPYGFPHPGERERDAERLQEETAEVCLKIVVRKGSASAAFDELLALCEARPDFVAVVAGYVDDLDAEDAERLASEPNTRLNVIE